MNEMHFNSIVCFGEVLWDMLPAGAEPGGAPMNVAIHLKKQGRNPWLVSRIGTDAEGDKLKMFLSEAGINLQYLQEDASFPTSKVLVHLDEQKNATYEICEPVAWDNIQLTDELENLAAKADLMIFGTLAARNPTTRHTLLRMLEISSSVKLLDVNLRPPYDNRGLVETLLYEADFVKLNDEELAQIALWSGQSGSEEDLAYWLSSQYSCRLVCVTRGAKGAMLLTENSIIQHPGYSVNAVDTVGAGDAFLAGLVSKLASGSSMEQALQFASATGALVATRCGAVPSYSQNDIESLFK